MSIRSLGERAARAGGWTIALNVASRVMSLVRVVVLARLLAPADFGTFAISLAVLAAVEAFTQSGFTAALVQKPGSVEAHLDTAWTIQVLRGLLLGLLIFATAPLIAAFFSEPRAVQAVRLIALVPLVRGVESIGTVRIQRDLSFGKQFAMSIGQVSADLIASLIAALVVGGAIALVIGFIAGRVAAVAISYRVSPYRPRLKIDLQRARELHKFGRWVAVNNILQFILLRFDNLVVGRLLGAVSLGMYDIAYRVSEVVTRSATQMVASVAFPVLSQVQDDKARLRRGYLTALELASCVGMPAAVALALTASPVVSVVLGSEWNAAAPVLVFLALAGGVRAVTATSGTLFMAVGQPELDFKSNVWRAAATYVLIVPLMQHAGVRGAGIAVLVGTLVAVPTFVAYVRQATGIRAPDIARATLPSLSLSGAIAVAWVLCRDLVRVESPVGLLLVGLSFLTAYILASLVLWRVLRQGPVRGVSLLALRQTRGRVVHDVSVLPQVERGR